jgi:peptidylprolyl isomerase
MAQAKKGDKVVVDYRGTLDDGTVFDSSDETADGCCCDDEGCDDESCDDEDCGCESGPLQFVIGEGNLLPAFEETVIGMSVGETRTVKIPAADAYGEHDDEMVVTMPRSEFPDDLEPHVGMGLELTQDDGESLVVEVVEVNDEGVTLDANHPLAGEDLTFEITLREIL